MRGFVTYRSCLRALALGVSLFALGGCAVETASGDPTSTEESKPAGSPSTSSAPAGESSSAPAAAPSSSAGAVLDPTRPVGTSSKPGTESSADAVKAETSTESNNCSGNNCGNQDNTQPLPWITR